MYCLIVKINLILTGRKKRIKLQSFKLGTDLENWVNAINECNFHANYAVIKIDQIQLENYLLCFNEVKIQIPPKRYIINI